MGGLNNRNILPPSSEGGLKTQDQWVSSFAFFWGNLFIPLLASCGLLAICCIPRLVGTSPQSLHSSSHNHLPLSKFPHFKKKMCIYVCLNLAALGLSCSKWDLVSRPGMEPGPPPLGARSLNHRITREVPKFSHFYKHTSHWSTLKTSFWLITSATTLSPNRVTFWDPKH